MATLHETAYPRLKPDPTAKELAEIYTPTEAEMAFVRGITKQPSTQLAVIIHLKLFQRLAYFTLLADVPDRIRQHIAQAARLRGTLKSGRLESYDTSGGKRRHMELLRQFLGVRPLDRAGATWLDTMALSAAETKHVVSDIINVLLEELIHHRYELPAFPEAIEAVFPHTTVQLCIVHMVRHSLNFVSWKRRPEVAADLRRIYTCATAEEAEQRLTEFEARWDAEYLPIWQSWRRNWVRLIPFFDYPPEIRKVIYTTNAIESVNMGLRKLTKHRGAFPSDEALIKLLYLALRNISTRWTLPIRDWKAALNRFTIQFEGRIPQL